MRRALIGLGLALGLAGCLTLADVINTIVTNAKLECSIAVSATDIATALAGTDPNVIIVGSIVSAICSQYKAAVPPTPTAPAPGEAPKAPSACATVLINGHPVKVNCP